MASAVSVADLREGEDIGGTPCRSRNGGYRAGGGDRNLSAELPRTISRGGKRTWLSARGRRSPGQRCRPTAGRTACATSTSGCAIEDSPTAWALSVSSKPTTATSTPGSQPARREFSERAQGQGVGNADQGRRCAAVEERGRRAATFASRRSGSGRVPAPVALRCAAPCSSRRIGRRPPPSRPANPGIRCPRWPRSIRCSVAMWVPAAPSTSTHGWWSVPSQGRPKVTQGDTGPAAGGLCGCPLGAYWSAGTRRGPSGRPGRSTG